MEQSQIYQVIKIWNGFHNTKQIFRDLIYADTIINVDGIVRGSDRILQYNSPGTRNTQMTDFWIHGVGYKTLSDNI